MRIKGIIRSDKRTKNLGKRLHRGDIAIIDHKDIDGVSADILIDARVRAVVNASQSCSGRYPNTGPRKLLEAGIIVIDNTGQDVFTKIKEGEEAEIEDSNIYSGKEIISSGSVLTEEYVAEQFETAKANLGIELEKFAENTLTYLAKEKDVFVDPSNLPKTRTNLSGKHVLVVVRGENYKEDLSMIRSYIREVKPVLIGVDGGADAIVELGLKPDIIVGDMDSVSDKNLASGAELIVQSYADGRAPGMDRLNRLGLSASVCAVPGTSEDLALLLAYEHGAEMIVAVGTHSHLVDFLDKGRKGMSSTFLVRLKVGHKLVDARGVSKLYRAHAGVGYIAFIALAAFVVLFVVIGLSPTVQERVGFMMEDARSQMWHLYTKMKIWQLNR